MCATCAALDWRAQTHATFSFSSVADKSVGWQHPLAVTFGPEEDSIAWFVAVGLAVMLEYKNTKCWHSENKNWWRKKLQHISTTSHRVDRLSGALRVACSSIRLNLSDIEVYWAHRLMNQDRSLFFMTWIMCYPTHSPLFLPFFFSSSFLNVQLLVLTSAWLPGARVLLHLSQRRQGRCQSLPSDVTFSATVINTHTHTRLWDTMAAGFFFSLTPFYRLTSFPTHRNTPSCCSGGTGWPLRKTWWCCQLPAHYRRITMLEMVQHVTSDLSSWVWNVLIT